MNIDDKTIEKLKETIKPDTFVTLTVRQFISFPDGAKLFGSPEVYDRVAASVMSQVSKRTCRKRQWRRRRGKVLPNITVLERTPAGLWHIHSCLRRPSGVTIDEFRQTIENCWKTSRWHMPQWEAVEIEGAALRYILKDGQDTILLGPSLFH